MTVSYNITLFQKFGILLSDSILHETVINNCEGSFEEASMEAEAGSCIINKRSSESWKRKNIQSHLDNELGV